MLYNAVVNKIDDILDLKNNISKISRLDRHVLISYIQDKYGIDTTEELHEYESRINNKDSEK